MASKTKETLLKEIRDQINRYEKGNMKRALLDGLYTKIKGYEDDRDIVNTVWANRDLPLRMFTEPELKHMPSFSNIIVGERYDKKIDYDKTFGKDWYKDISNIPYNQVAIIAAKQGRDPRQVIQEMTDEAIQKNRYDVAHEGALGTVMPIVAPRTQEAIARGEDPGLREYGLDLLQTGLEAVPYGRAAGFIGNKAGKFLVGRLLSNATAPVLTEAADAAAYDTTYQRGKFSLPEVAAGVGTNIMGESFFRLGGGFLNRVGADKVGKRLMNLGDGETLTQSLTKDLKDISKLESRNEMLMKRNAKGDALSTHTAGTNQQRLDAIDYEKNKDALQNRKQILEEIDFRYNNNKARDKVYGKVKHSIVPDNLKGFDEDWQPDEFGALTDEQLKSMMKDPVLQKYINVDMPVWPTEAQYMKEEAVKNLITNKLGGYQQEQGKAFTRIPFGIGTRLQKAYDDTVKEEERRKLEEELYNKYKFDLLGGR